MPNQSIHIPISAPPSEPLDLEPDAQGGLIVHAGSRSSLRLNQPRLRFLHVRGGAALRELDVAACAPGVDLTLENCPNLKRIRLPSGRPGAVLHLDLGAAVPALEVLGAFSSMDACWHAGDFAVQAPADQYYLNARLGTPERLCAEDHHFRLERGDEVGPVLNVAHDSHCRVLLVFDAPRLRTVRLGPALERLDLSACPNLTGVEGGRVRRLRVAACPALVTLDLQGQAGRLGAGAGADVLHVPRPWAHLTLNGASAGQLQAPEVQCLYLRDCSTLRSATLGEQTKVSLSGHSPVILEAFESLHLDQRAAASLLSRLDPKDPRVGKMLAHWCGIATRPGDYLETLLALASAVEVSPEWLWRLRCRLHARCNLGGYSLPDDDGCLRYAEQHWRWTLPTDLYLEGWEADVSLWLRLWRAGSSLIGDRRRYLPLEVVAALASVLSKLPSPPAAWLELLRGAIARVELSVQVGVADFDHVWKETHERLVSCVLRLGCRELMDTLVGRLAREPFKPLHVDLLGSLAVAGHVGARRLLRQVAEAQVAAVTRAPFAPEHIDLLGSLAAFGHAGARAQLMVLAHTLPAALRVQALSRALGAARSDVLAGEEFAYG